MNSQFKSGFKERTDVDFSQNSPVEKKPRTAAEEEQRARERWTHVRWPALVGKTRAPEGLRDPSEFLHRNIFMHVLSFLNYYELHEVLPVNKQYYDLAKDALRRYTSHIVRRPGMRAKDIVVIDNEATNIIQNCPNIKYLSLRPCLDCEKPRCSSLTCSSFKRVVTELSRLQYLNISLHIKDPDEFAKLDFTDPAWRDLRVLAAYDIVQYFTEEHWKQLTGTLPNLEVLALTAPSETSQAVQVPGTKAMMDFLRSCTKLRALFLDWTIRLKPEELFNRNVIDKEAPDGFFGQQLTHLCLNGLAIDENDLDEITHVAGATLQVLGFHGHLLMPEDFYKYLPRCQSLNKLDISGFLHYAPRRINIPIERLIPIDSLPNLRHLWYAPLVNNPSVVIEDINGRLAVHTDYNPDTDPFTLDHMCAEAMGETSEVVRELKSMFREKRWYTLCELKPG